MVVEVFVGVLGVVDDEGAAETVGVLAAFVAVVPVCAWLVDLVWSASYNNMRDIKSKATHREVLSQRTSRKDAALSDTNWTIHVGSSVHEESMEVQTGRLISERVLDIDNDLVAFGSNDWGNGPLVVDTNHRACLLAIWVGVGPAYVEVICDGCAVSDRSEQ